MRNQKIRSMAIYSLFLAVMLLMGLVPGLGYIQTGVAAIVIIQVPVIIAAYFLGYKGGIMFGFVFGFTSLLNCFIQPDAFAGIIMNAGGIYSVLLMIVCLFVPRILMGITTKATYDLICKFDKSKVGAMAVSAFIGTLTNTVFFLGAFYLFAKDACMSAFSAATSNALFTLMLGVVASNGIIEAITSVVLCTAIGQALHNFYFRKYPVLPVNNEAK